MRTFDWALYELFDAGMIAYEEALRNADSANELRLNIKLKSARGEPMVRNGGSLALDAMEEEAGEPSEKELWEARLGQEMQPQRSKAPEEHASTMQAIDQVRADRVLRMEKQRHKDDDELAILRKVKQA
jgi:twitching motility protein PilU